jgi:NAD(P)-dependent dehydrogenase (short-subunit alcohol dehydrogenase family)
MLSEAQGLLTGRVALVTGGSRGIGKAVAAAFARAGAGVFVCAKREGELNRAIRDIRDAGGEIDGLAGDVGQRDDVRCIAEAAAERYGAIHILVNNASLLGARDPISTYPASVWEEVIRVNLTGPFLMTQEILKTMLPQGRGSIINVSSGVGRVGKANWGAYAVSKFGLEGFTQMAAEELRETGIRVNAVNPGPTRTEMRAHAYPDEDPMQLPTPDDVVPVFLYLASDDSTGITGQSLDAQEWRVPVRN